MASRMNRPASNIGMQMETRCRSPVGIRASSQGSGKPGAEGALARGRPAVLRERDGILAALQREDVLVRNLADPVVEARVRDVDPVENPLLDSRPAALACQAQHVHEDGKQGPERNLRSVAMAPHAL